MQARADSVPLPKKPLDGPKRADAPEGDDAATERDASDGREPREVDVGRDPLVARLGAAVRRLRVRRGLSLERLAASSGVSRAMLSQIEHAKSAPTISVLYKIARALGASVADLLAQQSRGALVLRADGARWLTSPDGTLRVRTLTPDEAPRDPRLSEVRLLPGAWEELAPLPAGSSKQYIVTRGELEVVVQGVTHRLAAGDALWLDADAAHTVRNVGRGEAHVIAAETRVHAAARGEPHG
jgi:transcriptional regulator with XRE-family HTH domain